MQQTFDIEIFNKMKSTTWDEMRPVYEKLHKTILSVKKSIMGKLYTIYVQYYEGDDKVIAVVFFKNTGLDVGLALPNSTKSKKLKDAKYMSYPGITKSYMIRSMKDINKEFIKWLKISEKTAK